LEVGELLAVRYEMTLAEEKRLALHREV